MKIGILGAGNIGSALALHFRRLRHTVLIANSRGPETLSQVARETGAIPVAAAKAAKGVDQLVIAIPMKSMPSLPKDLLSELPASSPIIDIGNYYPLRDGVIPEIARGVIESEWTSRVLGRPVIKVFNNIVAVSLLHKGLPKDSKGRIALLRRRHQVEANGNGSSRPDGFRRCRRRPAFRILALPTWNAGLLPRSNYPAAPETPATSQTRQGTEESRPGSEDHGKTAS